MPEPASPDLGPDDRIDCPKCGALMRQLWLHDVLIDRCEVCLGIWLDAGERRRLLSDEKQLELVDIGSPDIGEEYNEIRDITCPRCKEMMRHVRHRRQNHIGFEYCDRCQGNFFDAGELTDMSQYTLAERVRSFLRLGSE